MRNRWRIWCLAIAAVPILLSVLAPREWITAAYSRGVFPIWQRAVVPVTGAVGLPITGILIVLAAGLVVWLAVRGYRRGRREGTPAWPLVRRGAGNAAVGMVVLYAVFLCTWGFGYRQVPVEERWGIASQIPGGELPAKWTGLAVLGTKLYAGPLDANCVLEVRAERPNAG